MKEVNQDVIKLELIFKSGKWFEPEPGIAHFTSLMLDKGVPGKTAYQIATQFDLFGASIDVSAGLDFSSVTLYALASNALEIFPLFFQLVTQPIFPDHELINAKDIFIQNLKLNLKKNSFVASRNIRKNIFGETHPYGAIIEETHIKSLSRESLLAYFKNQFVLQEVYLTGSLPDAVLKLMASQLEQLNSQSRQKINALHEKNNSPQLQHIDRTDSIQTSVRIGKRIINRNHPDYPALILLNHILGGYFGSRLMKNLREERGLTYGINSTLTNFANDSIFLIGTDINKPDRTLAIDEIMHEITLLSNQPVSPSELILARNHLLGGLQLDAANPFSIMDKIKSMRTYNLSSDYYSNLFQSILKTDADFLNQLALKHLATEELHIVTVG
ncbi:MAG: insulinase family protein [Cyclobacteriaceae bacterium]|nr:insulinase family protein [Cyclobacteriaceae bacterium]